MINVHPEFTIRWTLRLKYAIPLQVTFYFWGKHCTMHCQIWKAFIFIGYFFCNSRNLSFFCFSFSSKPLVSPSYWLSNKLLAYWTFITNNSSSRWLRWIVIIIPKSIVSCCCMNLSLSVTLLMCIVFVDFQPLFLVGQNKTMSSMTVAPQNFE